MNWPPAKMGFTGRKNLLRLSMTRFPRLRALVGSKARKVTNCPLHREKSTSFVCRIVLGCHLCALMHAWHVCFIRLRSWFTQLHLTLSIVLRSKKPRSKIFVCFWLTIWETHTNDEVGLSQEIWYSPRCANYSSSLWIYLSLYFPFRTVGSLCLESKRKLCAPHRGKSERKTPCISFQSQGYFSSAHHCCAWFPFWSVFKFSLTDGSAYNPVLLHFLPQHRSRACAIDCRVFFGGMFTKTEKYVIYRWP